MKKLAIVALSMLGLAGCAQYNVAGQFEGGGQAFVGTVSVAMQTGSIEVSSLDGRLQCSGSSEVTKMPSGYTTLGAQGRATATCNDGRTFKVDFIQSNETGGSGQGIDSEGNIVTMFFDSSASMARTKLDQQRLNSLIQ